MDTTQGWLKKLPFLLALVCAMPAVAAQPTMPVAKTAAAPLAGAPAIATTAKAPENPAPSNPALQEQIAKMPPIKDSGIDVAAQSKLVMDHLNATIRFYHNATGGIQKVGEPTDVLYAEQSAAEAASIARLAFQAASNQAMLLEKLSGGSLAPAAGTSTEAQRIATLRAQIAQQMDQLEASEQQLDTQIAKARGSQLASLRQQREQLEGGLELQKAMAQALNRVSAATSENEAQQGLAGDIARLQRSSPELTSNATKPAAPPPPQNLAAVNETGVSTQAVWLFQLLATMHSIDDQTKGVDELRKQAEAQRAPIVKLLRNTMQQGQSLSSQAVNLSSTDTQALANTRKTFDNLTAQFEVLSAVTLPLTQEIALLEQTRGTLTTWHTAVQTEYNTVLRSLLLRVGFIAIALLALGVISQTWGRLTVKYVSDIRRRRQFLLIRRFVIGFLSGLVIILGFVTQFNSLATFAGFITAGIAVGLQTILLSVAAYFFIIGRYGVRVGDRITVAGVTGEVIEVGLVRFYMTELGGSELHPTGRVAVFANSVLFSTGTPLYKQLPGTEYAWHELIVRLNQTADVAHVSKLVADTVNEVYATYKDTIERQHQSVENWVGTPIKAPVISSRVQLADAGLQLIVLFPVGIRNAAEIDSALATKIIERMNGDEVARAAAAAPPMITASIK